MSRSGSGSGSGSGRIEKKDGVEMPV